MSEWDPVIYSDDDQPLGDHLRDAYEAAVDTAIAESDQDPKPYTYGDLNEQWANYVWRLVAGTLRENVRLSVKP